VQLRTESTLISLPVVLSSCSSGSKLVADPNVERTMPFAFESRLAAVEDRVVSILKKIFFFLDGQFRGCRAD
jgi:hypothetical protein